MTSTPEHTVLGSPHRFVLIIEGGAAAKSAALVQAGCADASIGSVDGSEFAEFERHAPTLEDALASAIWAVESVDGLKVRRVEPDDLVTAAEIAERLGRSRESVRLLVKGARGAGDFPSPISHARSRQRLWRWSEIAAWAGTVDNDQRHRARLVATVNAALEYRRLAPTVGGFVPSLLGVDPPPSPGGPAQGSERAQPADPAPALGVPTPPGAAVTAPTTIAAGEGEQTLNAPQPAAASESAATDDPPRPSTSYWNRTRAQRTSVPQSDPSVSAPAVEEVPPDTKRDDRRLGRRHKVR